MRQQLVNFINQFDDKFVICRIYDNFAYSYYSYYTFNKKPIKNYIYVFKLSDKNKLKYKSRSNLETFYYNGEYFYYHRFVTKFKLKVDDIKEDYILKLPQFVMFYDEYNKKIKRMLSDCYVDIE